MKKQISKLGNFKSLATRLSLGFGIIIVLVLGMILINLDSMDQINNNSEELIEQDLELLILAEDLSINMLQRTNYIQAYALTGAEDYRTAFIEGTDDSIALETEALERGNSAQIQPLIDRKITWGELTDDFFDLIDNGNESEALSLFENQIMPIGTR